MRFCDTLNIIDALGAVQDADLLAEATSFKLEAAATATDRSIKLGIVPRSYHPGRKLTSNHRLILPIDRSYKQETRYSTNTQST